MPNGALYYTPQIISDARTLGQPSLNMDMSHGYIEHERDLIRADLIRSLEPH